MGKKFKLAAVIKRNQIILLFNRPGRSESVNPYSDYDFGDYSAHFSNFQQHYLQGRDDGYGAPSATYGAPSGSYGAPSESYGAPSYGVSSGEPDYGVTIKNLIISFKLQAIKNYSHIL